MGSIVMPKQSADKAEMKAVLSVFSEKNDWLENSELIEKLKVKIGDQLESQAYTKKAQIPAYFGFIEWEDPSNSRSKKRITSLGKRFYNALLNNDQAEINEELITSLETKDFGRNVHGCSSDSDVEPPKVFLKGSIILDFLTRKEYGYLLWQMDEKNKEFLELLSEIKINRLSNIFSYSNTPNKFNDAKPITALYNWGILEGDGTVSGQEKIKLSSNLQIGDLKRILNLEVTNNSGNSEIYETSSTNNNVIQKIYFGAPGTGKSHKVKEVTEIPEKDGRVLRVTFHPEYDYSSFVGGYKPTMGKDEEGKEVIKYEFVPQTFTNIYVKAWNSLAEGKNEDFYLVIEEINRGNCAEIFGDIFQLLDRDSDYDISPSKELKEFLETNKNGLSDVNKGFKGGKLSLPSNLNILATMNTSDQSLFPMDSAFKRRWDWEYIPIDYSRNTEENTSAKFVVELIENESFKWLDFIENVNKLIKGNDNLGMDKCLGNYFIKPDKPNNTISKESFVNKAIFYLWNDVFKDEMEDESIFKNKTSYEDFFPLEDKGVEKIKEILKILKLVNESSEE
jgi:hypothetical protein